VVGDAAQAIYSWRGANYKNLMLLKQDFANLTIVNLEQNYRSTKTILTAANKVISKNKNHPILNLWTNNSEGERINIIEAESEIEESAYVISKIKEEMQLTNKNFGDFAVLYRTNAQSRILEESFLHSGIPYSLVGGVRFYERKEIKDILAYLRLALNPEDEIAKKRAEKNGKTRLNNLLKELPMDTLSTIEALDKAMRATGYLDLFDENNEEDASRLENIKELRSVAMQHPNLADFLEIITLTEKEAKRKLSEASNSYDGAVTLMTIHAAKGLEFKNVFMVGLEEGIFPHSRSLNDPEQMEEERRLCYVGMTRAMEKLTLTYATRRLYFGTRSMNMVSRFISDIPENLINGGLKRRVGYQHFTKIGQGWGFDETGNWSWKPNDDNF
jgi:DNA helicase-2/ATP-dependent DNA helicase PcrA